MHEGHRLSAAFDMQRAGLLLSAHLGSRTAASRLSFGNEVAEEFGGCRADVQSERSRLVSRRDAVLRRFA